MHITTLLLSLGLLGAYYVTAASIEDLFQEDNELSEPDLLSPIACQYGVPTLKCVSFCIFRRTLPLCQTHNQPEPICQCWTDKVLPERETEVIKKQTESPPAESEPESPVDHFFMYFFSKISPLLTELNKTAEKSYILETVNANEGKLFYVFAYILIGLFVLISVLIVYELLMCRHNEDSLTEPFIIDKPNKTCQPYVIDKTKSSYAFERLK